MPFHLPTSVPRPLFGSLSSFHVLFPPLRAKHTFLDGPRVQSPLKSRVWDKHSEFAYTRYREATIGACVAYQLHLYQLPATWMTLKLTVLAGVAQADYWTAISLCRSNRNSTEVILLFLFFSFSLFFTVGVELETFS